jgi:hypothetical protein
LISLSFSPPIHQYTQNMWMWIDCCSAPARDA